MSNQNQNPQASENEPEKSPNQESPKESEAWEEPIPEQPKTREDRDRLTKEQIQDALEMGDTKRAAELFARLNAPDVPPPAMARMQIYGGVLTLLLFLWFAIPMLAMIWDWWY